MKHQNIQILFFVILVLQIKIAEEKCISCQTCNTVTGVCDQCPNGYKTSNPFPSNCYKCNGTGDYFVFNYSLTPPVCEFVTNWNSVTGITNPKLVYDTNEVVEVCPLGTFLFNHICYKDNCPPNTELVSDNITFANECRCSYKYVYDSTNNEYNCLSQNEPCPASKPLYNGTASECLAFPATATEKLILRLYAVNGIQNYQILTECNQDEYKFDSPSANYTECVKDCKNEEFQYHYLNESKCVQKCDVGDYEYEKERICYKSAEECPSSYNILQSSATDPHKCVDYEYCIDSGNPYFYELTKTCLPNCTNLITLNSKVPNTPMYELFEVSSQDSSVLIKKCVAQCPPDKPFLDKVDTDKFRCVSKCGLDGLRTYTFNNTCYDNCLSITGYEYSTDDTLECVAQCPEGYFQTGNSSEKICYKSCSYLITYNYHYNKSCVANETCPFYIDDNGQNICYDSCPISAPYYNFGSNKCFSSTIGCNDPKNDPTFIYTDFNNSFVCKSSCSDPNNYITEDFVCLTGPNCTDSYPYEFNNVCYKNKCPNDNMKYEFVNGIKKCYYANNCTDTQYIQNGECVEKCNVIDYPYFISPQTGFSGQCFKTVEECYKTNYIYTNATKECMQNCTNGFTIQNVPGTFHPYELDIGNCLASCPPDFPYQANKICYKEGCPSGYFAQNDTTTGMYLCETTCTNTSYFVFQNKLCVPDCKDTSDIFYVKGDSSNVCYFRCPPNKPYYYTPERECLADCGGSSYYDPDTKECFKNCSDAIGTPKIFAFEASSSTNNPCLTSCPDGYYYISNATNLFCISSCPDGYYHSQKDNKVCVPFCQVDEKLGYNNVCVKECPEFYYFSKKDDTSPLLTICSNNCSFSGKNESAADVTFNFVVDSTKQCVDKCPTNENHIYENKCYKQCPKEKPYYYESSSDNSTCYSVCPDSQPYIINGLNECIPNCTAPFNYHLENSYVCYNKCPSEYPAEDASDVVNNITICLKRCPAGLVNEDNKCVKTCNSTGSGYKPFYDPVSNTCYSKCPNSLPFYSPSTSGSFYQCKIACDISEFVLSTNECVSNCTDNYNFIGKGNICKTQCDADFDGKYYYNTSQGSLFQCVDACKNAPNSKNLRVEDNFECVDACPTNHPYKSPLNICYANCKVNPEYSFSLVDSSGNYLCALECSGDRLYYLEDKICINETECLSMGRVINEYNQCILKCDPNSYYKYNLDGKCSPECNSTLSKYSLRDYVCVDKCVEPLNYVRNKKICESSCDSKSLAYFAYKAEGQTEFECVEQCPSGKYYYEGGYNCTSCDNYIVQDTQKCAFSCRDLPGYYFFNYDSSDTSSTYQNNTCVKTCLGTSKPFTLENDTCTSIPCMTSSATHKFYRERDKICLVKCPDNYIYDSNYTCVINCNATQFLLPTGKCADQCDSSTLYVYYIAGENECLKKCPDNYYKNGYECVRQCNDTKPFANDGECVEQCANETKYYVSKFTHGEIDTQQKCLTDCIPEYPFLMIDNSSSVAKYGCVGSCPNYYLSDRDPNVFAKECKDNCESDTPFIGDYNQCLTKCPNEKPFYIPSTDNKNQICLEKCNQTAPYHGQNETYQCISQCTTDFINYKDLGCVDRCDKNQYWANASDINGVTKTFCLDECNTVFGLYSTPNRECVANCTVGNYTANYDTRKCECINLYKIDEETGQYECYDPTILSCLNNKDGFIYLKENTKRCLKNCPTTVSAGVCLDSSDCPPNSYLILSDDGNKKCVCRYKFYRDGLNQLVCLGENENCLPEYQYYVMETQECVKSCPSNHSKIFHSYCLEKCPQNSQESNNICTCKKNWYIDSNKVNNQNENEFICMIDSYVCPEQYPFSNNETNECVAKCTGTNFIYYNDQCLQACSGTENPSTVTAIDKNDPLYKFANYTCRCNSIWYYEIDKKNVKCFGADKTKCSDIVEYNYRYMVRDTKQCVATCPSDHPYSFNSLCFYDCGHDPFVYGYKLKNDESSAYKCKCEYPWTMNSDYEKECGNHPYCTGSATSSAFSSDYLLISSTNECVKLKDCPDDHPLKFNGICYDRNPVTCPEGTRFDTKFGGECTCDNLWYYVSVSYKGSIQDKFCLKNTTTNCPYEYPYLVNDTLECSKVDCITSNFYQFNHVCYQKACPQDTKQNSTTSKVCVCDNSKGYWYEEVKQEVHYICGLTKCPQEKPMHINGELECLHSCQDKKSPEGKYYYTLDDTCYLEDDCPKNSVANATTKECIYRHLNNATNLTELYKFVNEDILRLYSRNVSAGGFTYKAYNTTLQIYALNKNGNVGSEALVLKSDLSYINLENCINQIYDDNDLLDSDNIIVVKYDLLNITDKYMMNPVEYEFYSSRTGKKIDATVCQSRSLVISYPITYVSNKYDNFSQGDYKNNFKSKFSRGKILQKQDSEIDTFNSNNSIYYDLCISCEIEGKDLVLKDRISYLYPDVSLCEENCTYSKTDFEQERVYCNCSLKKEFDFQRDYKISNYNFSIREIDSLQKGPSNVASMKCLSRLSEVETISKNGGFYYSVFVLAGEIALCSIAATVGFQSVSSVIGSSFGTTPGNVDAQTNNAFEEIKIQDPSSLPKSNPPSKISNPPPKITNDENENNNNNNNINLSENDRLNKKVSNEINVEFIPQEFVFIFFDMTDKGVTKQIPRSHIPFSINPKTNRLIQKMAGNKYSKDLIGPYSENQNIVDIIEDEKKVEYNKEILDSKENALENEVLNINDRNKNRKVQKNNVQNNIMEKTKNSEFINIKKGSKSSKRRGISNKKKGDIDELTDDDYKPSKGNDMFISEEILYRAIRKEARLLRAPYEISLKHETSNILVLILTEICDKIYFLRTLLLTKKYEIFVVKVSLYILYHIMLLTIIAFFFDIKTIQKIFNEDDYPDLAFYLLYGFLSNLIVWFVYKMLKCFLSNFKRINQLIKLQNDYEKTHQEGLLKDIYRKKKNFVSKTKIKLIIYFCIQFVIVIFCCCYLIMFCGIYTGTKKKVFKAYGITILEMIIIKLIYALILCLLRKASLEANVKGLYTFTRFLETYFS